VTSQNKIYQFPTNHLFTDKCCYMFVRFIAGLLYGATNITQPNFSAFANLQTQCFDKLFVCNTTCICCQQHSATANTAHSYTCCVKRGTGDSKIANGLGPHCWPIRIRFGFFIAFWISVKHNIVDRNVLYKNTVIYKLSNFIK
jgi:hypothetical protein